MRDSILSFLLFLGLTVYPQEKPNILWLVCEDISPTLSFYGDPTIHTPNLDALAKESLVFDNAFAPVGVCAPSRSAIITGMQPTSIGTMHMRTGKDVQSWGKRVYQARIETKDLEGHPIQEYAVVLPDYVHCFTEYLRAEGYFCSNNQKTDYQFAAPVTAWDENNKQAHWRHRKTGQPFFSVFNFGITHESQLWKKESLPLTVSPDSVPVPPYLPNTLASRKTIARHYSNVALLDHEIGELLNQLKADGLYESTIIFFYSDHGGPLPHQKREIYDPGLKVPFMIKGLRETQVGRTDRLISFVDLAPTLLSLANIPPPSFMDGMAFTGAFQREEREYIYGSSDRFDEFSDRIRSVRDKRYLYIRNYYPELPKYKDIGYRKQIPMMPSFLEQAQKRELDSIQMAWFQTKTVEELYDCEKDPHNIKNLLTDPLYSSVLNRMREAFDKQWIQGVDLGMIPEKKLIDAQWPNGEQPQTEDIRTTIDGGKIRLYCPTKGASIGYIYSEHPLSNLNLDSTWQLYTHPLKLNKGWYLYTLAQRIGFKETEIQEFRME